MPPRFNLVIWGDFFTWIFSSIFCRESPPKLQCQLNTEWWIPQRMAPYTKRNSKFNFGILICQHQFPWNLGFQYRLTPNQSRPIPADPQSTSADSQPISADSQIPRFPVNIGWFPANIGWSPSQYRPISVNIFTRAIALLKDMNRTWFSQERFLNMADTLASLTSLWYRVTTYVTE